MFSWSRPSRTFISPQTAASFPLTFFFGIILSATCFTIPESSAFFKPLEVINGFEFLRTPGEGIDSGDGELGLPPFFVPDDPFPGMVLITLAGTCHLAACFKRASGGFTLVCGAQQTRMFTHHDFSKRPSSKQIKNLVLLLLCEARGLREESIRKVRYSRHG